MPYKLTPIGQSMATKTTRVSDPESAIIVYLYEHPTESVEADELVGELRTSERVVLSTLDRLINKEYVKEL